MLNYGLFERFKINDHQMKSLIISAFYIGNRPFLFPPYCYPHPNINICQALGNWISHDREEPCPRSYPGPSDQQVLKRTVFQGYRQWGKKGLLEMDHINIHLSYSILWFLNTVSTLFKKNFSEFIWTKWLSSQLCLNPPETETIESALSSC